MELSSVPSTEIRQLQIASSTRGIDASGLCGQPVHTQVPHIHIIIIKNKYLAIHIYIKLQHTMR